MSERIVEELKNIAEQVKELNVKEAAIKKGKQIKKIVLKIEDLVINEFYNDILTYVVRLKKVLEID